MKFFCDVRVLILDDFVFIFFINFIFQIRVTTDTFQSFDFVKLFPDLFLWSWDLHKTRFCSFQRKLLKYSLFDHLPYFSFVPHQKTHILMFNRSNKILLHLTKFSQILEKPLLVIDKRKGRLVVDVHFVFYSLPFGYVFFEIIEAAYEKIYLIVKYFGFENIFLILRNKIRISLFLPQALRLVYHFYLFFALRVSLFFYNSIPSITLNSCKGF